jgi:hypothetical protein
LPPGFYCRNAGKNFMPLATVFTKTTGFQQDYAHKVIFRSGKKRLRRNICVAVVIIVNKSLPCRREEFMVFKKVVDGIAACGGVDYFFFTAIPAQAARQR